MQPGAGVMATAGSSIANIRYRGLRKQGGGGHGAQASLEGVAKEEAPGGHFIPPPTSPRFWLVSPTLQRLLGEPALRGLSRDETPRGPESMFAPRSPQHSRAQETRRGPTFQGATAEPLVAELSATRHRTCQPGTGGHSFGQAHACQDPRILVFCFSSTLPAPGKELAKIPERAQPSSGLVTAG